MWNAFMQAGGQTLAMAGYTLPIIGISLMGTELLVTYGVLRRLQGIFQPLVRLACLPAEAGPALVVAVGSPLAADTLVASHGRSGRLSRSQVFLAAQANTLPSYITETFTYMLPIMLPALGGPAGWLYVAAFIWAGVIKIVFLVVFGRWLYRTNGDLLQKRSESKDPAPALRPDPKNALKKACRLLVRITTMLVVTYFIISWIYCLGYLDKAAVGLGPFLARAGLAEELFLPVLAFAASPMAGAGAVGALYKSGAVTAQAAASAALAGSLLALPVFALRYSLARNMAVFGTFLGGMNVLASLLVGMIARVTAIMAVPFFSKGMSGAMDIRYWILSLTTRCNLHCAYCYADAGARGMDMTEAVLEAALNRIARGAGPAHVQLTGGEPTLVPRLLEKAIRGLHTAKRPLTIGVQTNGTLLTPELMNLFNKNRVQVGVSLDGPPAIQESVRGLAAQTLRGLQLLETLQVPFRITTVVSEANATRLDRLLVLLAGFSSARGMGLDLLVEKGRAVQNQSACPAGPRELKAGIQKMLEVLKAVNRRRSIPLRLRGTGSSSRLFKKRKSPLPSAMPKQEKVLPCIRTAACFPAAKPLGTPHF